MNIDEFKTIPIGAIITRSESEQSSYLQAFFDLPANVKKVATAPHTGAYLRGVSKTYGISTDKTSLLALAILKIAIGELQLAQLAAYLSSEFQLANDKAQRAARDIEKDLLAPISLELNRFLSSRNNQKNTPTRSARSAYMPNNLLNLKDQKQTPKPPPIPPQKKY